MNNLCSIPRTYIKHQMQHSFGKMGWGEGYGKGERPKKSSEAGLCSPVEETARRDSASKARWDGRTDSWKKLFFEFHTDKLTLRK